VPSGYTPSLDDTLEGGGRMSHILYVEDNADHAELVMRQLEKQRLRQRVVHVEDGERAMAVLDAAVQGHQPLPRFVLLDLRLPRMDGMEVLARMRASDALRLIPVIIFTTSTTSRDVQAAYSHHANSYLVKPDDTEELSRLLGELSQYWLDRNVASPAT
jgi:CheY-like chemotaxis protein